MSHINTSESSSIFSSIFEESINKAESPNSKSLSIYDRVVNNVRERRVFLRKSVEKGLIPAVDKCLEDESKKIVMDNITIDVRKIYPALTNKLSSYDISYIMDTIVEYYSELGFTAKKDGTSISLAWKL
ncbi:Hypothetical protein ORPV_56 [Orpheovirus IHUMI-LCC2]|uniref:Uncharacterized protein n=1 Tax=Orpheovirus IHUMI-LCC2 TaxID=2023057 RepID=A0A2I2L375_9VIRU|nr:Hypothetical protein ORPV_56 [Orpheovirus IHUMI-LCC2]SNW61960.1 Hypothetical protein ORPV_56 [Orpheovirus IHUMI-LCC2]